MQDGDGLRFPSAGDSVGSPDPAPPMRQDVGRPPTDFGGGGLFASYSQTPNYAPFFPRLLGSLVDSVVVAAMILGVLFGASLASRKVLVAMEQLDDGALSDVGELPATLVILATAVVVPLLYHVLLETGPHQATLGKRLLGLRIVNEDGQTISKGQSIGRFFASAFLSRWFLCAGYLMALFTSKKQTLHDMLAGTLVIRD